MTTETAACTAVIVTYNNAETIRECLDSLFARSGIPVEVVVVDNSPGDGDEGTAEAVACFRREHPEEPVRLIRRPDNVGFAAGCNLGARESTAEYLLFMNPDASCLNDVPGELAGLLGRRGDVRTVGPQLLDARRGVVPAGRGLVSPCGGVCEAAGLERLLAALPLLRFSPDKPRAADQVLGARRLKRRAGVVELRGMA